MEKPIKIAIAGSGYGRKVALPVYSELEEFEPVTVWSRRPERARELAEEAGVGLSTADFDELVTVPGWPRGCSPHRGGHPGSWRDGPGRLQAADEETRRRAIRGADGGELRRVTAEDAYALLLQFRGEGLEVVTLAPTA